MANRKFIAKGAVWSDEGRLHYSFSLIEDSPTRQIAVAYSVQGNPDSLTNLLVDPVTLSPLEGKVLPVELKCALLSHARAYQ